MRRRLAHVSCKVSGQPRFIEQPLLLWYLVHCRLGILLPTHQMLEELLPSTAMSSAFRVDCSVNLAAAPTHLAFSYNLFSKNVTPLPRLTSPVRPLRNAHVCSPADALGTGDGSRSHFTQDVCRLVAGLGLKHGGFNHHIAALSNNTGKVGGEAEAPVDALRVGLHRQDSIILTLM